MTGLEHPGWRAAFDEAWASWCSGNYGIGAALIDPATLAVVSQGRNRVAERTDEPGVLAGNFLAHAEMNAFAALPRMLAADLDLYTTLEPCAMCSGTSVMMHVAHIHFAAADDLMTGIHDLWAQHAFTAPRAADRSGPLDGELQAFARVLPLTFTAVYLPEGDAAENARAETPDLWDLATALMADGGLAEVKADGGSVADALAVVQATG